MDVVRTLAAAERKKLPPSADRNAERTVQRLFSKHNLSLGLEVVTREHAIEDPTNKKITTYHIMPQSWVEFMLEQELDNKATPEVYFRSFWEVYRLSHPEHEVFRDSSRDLGLILPVLLHGDEGRSQKKTSYLVLSMQNPISFKTKKCYDKPCTCEAELASTPGLPTFGQEKPDLLPESALQAALS